MQIWIVYTEYQADEPIIEGVFSTKALAEAHRMAVVRAYKEGDRGQYIGGTQVYHEEDEGEDPADWEVDVHVEEYTVDEHAVALIEAQ